MKKTTLIAVVLSLTLVISCKPKSNTTHTLTNGTAGGIVATVNGEPITHGQLEAAAKNQLQKVSVEIYEIKKSVLDQMIEEKLIESAAAKEKLEVDEFIEKRLEAEITPPTEEEIKSFYEANKGRTGGKPLAEMKASIEDYLLSSQQRAARTKLLATLKEEAKVQINLDVPRVEIDIGSSPYRGPQNAPVVVVEFTDYQCPFCKRVRPTVNEILATYPDQVKYVLMDFPLSFHKNAPKAHEAAHCAQDQGKYWEYSKELFANQQALTIADLKKYARQINLKSARFNKCLDNGKYEKPVRENLQKGASTGVSGTPAFFVNGISLSGAQPFARFKAIIDSELERLK